MTFRVPFALAPFALILATLGHATPGCASVGDALNQHILPGLGTFTTATETLAEAAARDCQPDALRPAYHAAFDAWMPVADLRIGPSETAALSILFWPDARGATQRTLARLIAEEDPVAEDVQGYARVSIAARGLMALDMLLFDPGFAGYARGSYTCALVRTVAQDLDAQADALEAAWRGRFTETLHTAGQPGNITYLTEDEGIRALYTQVLSSLAFTADQRLGQPLGTPVRPRPTRAEARRSGRSLRNVVLATNAAHDLATALADWDLPRTDAARAAASRAATAIADPTFQDVGDPQGWQRADALQQAVRDLRAAIEADIGARMGIAPGFNAQDGD